MIRIVILSLLCLILAADNAQAGKVGQLMALGKSQKRMKKQFGSETSAYQRLMKDVENKRLAPGTALADIKRKYGPPIAEYTDKSAGQIRLLYKPASSSHFEGEKVHLYFDASGKFLRHHHQK